MMRHQQPADKATAAQVATATQDDFKMSAAELRYEAPLATFDTDEWNEFLVTSSSTSSSGTEVNIDDGEDLTNISAKLGNMIVEPVSRDQDGNNVVADDDNVGLSGSLEDLVNTFDAKITKCFRNYNEHAEEIAPVQIRTQEELLADSQSVHITLHYAVVIIIVYNRKRGTGSRFFCEPLLTCLLLVESLATILLLPQTNLSRSREPRNQSTKVKFKRRVIDFRQLNGSHFLH